jgi:hypothetical protein
MRLKSDNAGLYFGLQAAEFTSISAARRFAEEIFTPMVVAFRKADFQNSSQAEIHIGRVFSAGAQATGASSVRVWAARRQPLAGSGLRAGTQA